MAMATLMIIMAITVTAKFHKKGCGKDDDDDVEHDDDHEGHHFKSTSVDSGGIQLGCGRTHRDDEAVSVSTTDCRSASR